MPHHAVILVPHPMASRPAVEVEALARAAFPRILAALTAPAPRPLLGAPSGRAGLEASRVELPADIDAFTDAAEARGWSDGLPLIPPTEDRVARLLEAVRLAPSAVLGVMPPRNGTVTAEKFAANAVMAGAMPLHAPLALAAVRAGLREEFNPGGIGVTTGGGTPLVIVNGPEARRAGVNGGTSCFGSGYRANAVVGRALRLVMRNLGGAIPGEMKKSTQAFPAEYSFCTAEAEDESPWEPLHVELGYGREQSTVSLAGVRAFHQVTDHTSERGEQILETIAGSMRAWGAVSYYYQGRQGQVLVALCPEHAREIAAAGYTKEAVKRFLFECARLPKRDLVGRGNYGERTWPPWIEEAGDDTLVPIVAEPGHLIVIVAGGSGRHSSWLPLWSATRLVTELVGLTR
ncbi:MAG: hypothetical protein HYV92_01350 [Candidatus Rokubacteria bacterium]|nr:hypothetical protein [Candidatus Rokubacteria bacterium]MBI2544151.1 hypothetical protein [Candidatus Rokubacteria bacterium]MBI2553086.1 hypothetical protein [Candidatus Rokubacteria bacterium]